MTTILTAATALEAFRGFIVMALSALNGTVYSKQAVADYNREDMPYATIEWLRSRALSSTPYRRVGDEVDPEHAGGLTHEDVVQQLREGVVQLVGYGDTIPELFELLPLIKVQLDEQKYLNDQGIAIRELSEVIDTRTLRDTTWEVSALQEWAVIYAVESVSRIGTIETATADPTLTG